MKRLVYIALVMLLTAATTPAQTNAPATSIPLAPPTGPFAAAPLGPQATALPSFRDLPIDRYAAMVNDRIITVGELMVMATPMERQLRALYTGTELEKKLDEAWQETLGVLVDRALILEEFEELSGGDRPAMSLPDRAVDDYINNVIHQRFDDDRTRLEQALAGERMTFMEWRADMRNRLIVMIMQNREVGNRVIITPRMVLDAYQKDLAKYSEPDMIKLRMITLPKEDDPAQHASVRTLAVELARRLRAGEDFGALAKQYSKDVAAAQGGDMGWLEPGDLRKELTEAAAGLPEATAVSDPIETADSIYILRIDGKKAAHVRPLQEVRDEIQQRLRDEESKRLYTAWTDRLRKKFYIKIFDTPERGGGAF